MIKTEGDGFLAPKMWRELADVAPPCGGRSAGLPAVPSSRVAELGEKDRGCPSGHHALCLGQVKSSNLKENPLFLDVDVNGTIDRSITAEIETEPIFGVRAELQPSSKDRSPVLGHFDLFCT